MRSTPNVRVGMLNGVQHPFLRDAIDKSCGRMEMQIERWCSLSQKSTKRSDERRMLSPCISQASDCHPRDVFDFADVTRVTWRTSEVMTAQVQSSSPTSDLPLHAFPEEVLGESAAGQWAHPRLRAILPRDCNKSPSAVLLPLRWMGADGQGFQRWRSTRRGHPE